MKEGAVSKNTYRGDGNVEIRDKDCIKQLFIQLFKNFKKKMPMMSKEMRNISRKVKIFKKNKWEFQNRKVQDLT